MEHKGYNSHTIYVTQLPLSYRGASSSPFSLENFRGARILCPCCFVPDTTRAFSQVANGSGESPSWFILHFHRAGEVTLYSVPSHFLSNTKRGFLRGRVHAFQLGMNLRPIQVSSTLFSSLPSSLPVPSTKVAVSP